MTSPQQTILSYEETVNAPDACHVIKPEAQREIQGGNELVLTRVLVREPGICAQVITPVAVSGTVEKANVYSKITLRVVDAQGRDLSRFVLKG